MRPDPGWTLSLDQASNTAGASLWFDGNLYATSVLLGGGSPVFSRRLVAMQENLTRFLDSALPPGVQLSKVIFEGVHARLVLVTVGAFLCSPRIDAKLHAQHSFIASSTWKKWAQEHGATGIFKDIKGVKALKETGFDTDKVSGIQDDVADSIMIYYAWRKRR